MKREAEQKFKELVEETNRILNFVKNNGKDLEGERCMRKKDGSLAFSEKHRKRLWKEHIWQIS